MATTRETKQADERGRISLGAAFANCTFLVEEIDDGIVIRQARVIPEREAWLYENKEALRRVREGLADARAGGFGSPPSLEDAERIVEEMPDSDS